MKSVLKVKSKNTQVAQEKVEPKYVEDKATEQYLDYINESGNVMRHNGDKYVNTGINLKGPRGAVGPRGLPGKDGITPHIGENGNWYIGEQDTGSKAELNTDEYVTKEELEDVIGNAPEALDTLKELADSLGNDVDFATHVNNSINGLNEKVNDIQSVLPKYDPTNGHEYVDLGLPSGTLWATCNVGANAPEEHGDYYMWGMGNKTYNAEDTPYDGTEDPLDLSRDTARQVMGGAWRMPMKAQMEELTTNTTYQWVTNYKDSGIDGGLFTATNGAVLFLPAAGLCGNDGPEDVGIEGDYWCSSSNGRAAYGFCVSSDNKAMFSSYRDGGYTVRGVINKDDVESETFAQVASKDDIDELKENLTFTETTYSANGHEYVEIGGIKWATMNVGATSETDYGLYFQWGDTKGYTADQVGTGEGQKAFTWADYKYSDNGNLSVMTKYNATDGKTVLDLEDDAVAANWGGKWRMPTTEELQALGNAVDSVWTENYNGSGIDGLLCIDKTDSSKTLFFPATGQIYNNSIHRGQGYATCVYSSSRNINSVYITYYLNFDSEYTVYNEEDLERFTGCAIRGVLDDAEVEPITTTYTANRVVIPIDSFKNAATNKKVINANTAVPYITDTENYLVIKESENLHSGTVIVEANLSGKGLCCPANMMYKEGQYYIYSSLPLDNIKDNLKDLILYCYQIEDYVAPATPVTAHKLWFDDFPEDKLDDIINARGFDNWEDFVADLVNDPSSSISGGSANGYIYTGETFNWNGIEYYLWESDGVVVNIPYIITDTINYDELYPNSLEADSSNKYCPYVGKLSSDMEVIYTKEDKRGDILIKVEP